MGAAAAAPTLTRDTFDPGAEALPARSMPAGYPSEAQPSPYIPEPLEETAGALPSKGLPNYDHLVDLPGPFESWPYQAGGASGRDAVAPDERLFPGLEIEEGNPLHVRRLQTELNEAARALGASPTPVDGVLGEDTRRLMAAVGEASGDPEGASNPSTAYRMALGLYKGPAGVSDLQAPFLDAYRQNPDNPLFEGAPPSPVDDIVGPLTLETLSRYRGQPTSEADLTPEQRDQILYEMIYGNRRYREQRERRGGP